MNTRIGFAVRLLLLAAAYVVTAKFGIEQPVAHGVITPVWAPTGIAIAVLILAGPRYWPGVALGAFVANATSGVSILVAAVIAAGNTLEALTAQYLLRRSNFSAKFDRAHSVLLFVTLAALVATMVSATIGVTVLTVAAVVDPSRYLEEWLLWWFGDAMGALLVAPAILVWATALRHGESLRHRAEAGALLLLLIGTSVAVFIGGNWKYPYLIFPLLIWAALRFRTVGAATAIFVVGSIATWGTVQGSVPIGGATATQAVQILQALIAVVGVGTFVIAATISERDAAEVARAKALDQLHERNVRYETLLGAVSDLGEGFVVTDAGRLIFANEAYCKMTGYTLAELMELPSLVELTAPEERGEIENRLRERLSGGDVLDHYETTLIRRDGARVSCEVAVKLFDTEGGSRIISVVRDVTDRKRMESFRDNFLAYAAHELRGPIVSMASFARLLKQRGSLSTADIDGIVERIIDSGDLMHAQFETILRIARAESGGAELAPEKIDVGDFVAHLLGGLPVPDGKSLELAVDESVHARIDKSALNQILTNLVTNAYKYGGRHVRVSVSAVGEETLIEVFDDGEGVPADLVPSVFDPFVRASRSMSGAGLGLALVKALATASGGNVEYRSSDPGATFAVSLPSAK